MTARLLPLLTVVLASTACGPGPEPVPPASVVLISIDTTRADHLGLSGYERDTTPGLDALADAALVFEQAVAPSENTLVSHATLFTGLQPAAHGADARDGGRGLDPAFTTIAEAFSAGGRRTGGFATHGDWLTAAFSMDQGFGTFVSEYVAADTVLERARRWLAADPGDAPFFLFVHLFDVHSDRFGRPYGAPPPFLGRYTEGYDGPLADLASLGAEGSGLLREIMDRPIPLTEADVQHLRDQYDEGLAAADASLGAFVAELRAREHPPWIVITSDHGEAFLEHGRTLHSSFHEEVVRVPLIVVPPPSRAAALGVPRRVTEPVGLIDLAPTLLSLAGLPGPTPTQGRDLSPWLEGRAPRLEPLRVLFYEQGLRTQGFKLLGSGAGTRLYDLTADPDEAVDRSRDPAYAERLAGLRAVFDQLVSDSRLLREAVVASGAEDAPEPTEEQLRRLTELGYTR